MRINKLSLRKVHRWLGLFAGIQLLAWTVSGLYFSAISIDEIHGDHILAIEAEQLLASSFELISISELVRSHPPLVDAGLLDFKLYVNNGQPVFVVKRLRFDAQSGEALDKITESQALEIVEARTGVQALGVSRVEEVEPGSEYRGGDLPAWKIDVAEDNASIYVSATTGKLRAVRTTYWRIFDFLWSLHIMDYEERDDFNNWLLIFMASLGVITVLSGLTLFALTQRFRPRQSR
ncbi:MAG: PepSY domain-containing protein [Pseudomonadales bacterium]|jgi:uncharacterized iron-regulated membrane protein